MICSKCGAKLGDGDLYCTLCGGVGIEENQEIENSMQQPIKKPVKQIKKIKLYSIFTLVAGLMCAVLLILGIVFCNKGFDYKNNYFNSEDYPSQSENAYVGGDAYNYIINGTYFSGYLDLGGSFILSGIACACAGSIIYIIGKKEDKRE